VRASVSLMVHLWWEAAVLWSVLPGEFYLECLEADAVCSATRVMPFLHFCHFLFLGSAPLLEAVSTCCSRPIVPDVPVHSVHSTIVHSFCSRPFYHFCILRLQISTWSTILPLFWRLMLQCTGVLGGDGISGPAIIPFVLHSDTVMHSIPWRLIPMHHYSPCCKCILHFHSLHSIHSTDTIHLSDTIS